MWSEGEVERVEGRWNLRIDILSIYLSISLIFLLCLFCSFFTRQTVDFKILLHGLGRKDRNKQNGRNFMPWLNGASSGIIIPFFFIIIILKIILN